MKKNLSILAAVALLAAPASAEVEVETSSELERGDHGSFEAESKIEREDDAGSMTRKTEVDVDLDADGEGTAERTTTIVNDPDGLLNKTKTKIEETREIEDGQVSVHQKKTVDGDVVEEHSSTH